MGLVELQHVRCLRAREVSSPPYLMNPAMRIGSLTALDADQPFAKPSGGVACLASGDLKLPAAKLDRADASNDGSGAAGECLLQPAARGIGFQLFE